MFWLFTSDFRRRSLASRAEEPRTNNPMMKAKTPAGMAPSKPVWSRSTFWVGVLLALEVFLFPTIGRAERIELSFDRLPSQQGWTYSGRVPESSVFSVAEGVLRMDGRGLGDTMARYQQIGVIDATLPFTLEARLRIVDSDTLSPYDVFELGAHGPKLSSYWSWSIGQGSGFSRVSTMVSREDGAGVSVGMNIDSGFHDYFMNVTPGGTFQAYIDGKLFASGATPEFEMNNLLLFQDSSREAEGVMEMRRFVFQQAIPEPSSDFICCFGAAVLLASHRRIGREKMPEAQKKR